VEKLYQGAGKKQFRVSGPDAEQAVIE